MEHFLEHVSFVVAVASLFYFGKNYTIVIEISYLQCPYNVKSKLVTALAAPIYTEGPFGLQKTSKIYILKVIK